MKTKDFIANYLYQNYYNDCARLAKVQIIAAMVKHETVAEIPALIDKVAIINGIKKSYPPAPDIRVIA